MNSYEVAHKDENTTTPIKATTDVVDDANSVAEAQLLGQMMANAFGRAVSYLVRHHHQSRQEAEEHVLTAATDARTQAILKLPAQRVTYLDMIRLQSRDPMLAAYRWQTVRQRATESWRNGEAQARALSQSDEESLWELANFLAAREALGEGCAPRNGIEAALLDEMAQLQILRMKWLQILVERSNRDIIEEVGLRKKLRAPELSAAQSIEQAVAMVDRLQRMFMRAHRAFQESRKAASVVVQNASQVNVGQQQINISP